MVSLDIIHSVGQKVLKCRKSPGENMVSLYAIHRYQPSSLFTDFETLSCDEVMIILPKSWTKSCILDPIPTWFKVIETPPPNFCTQADWTDQCISVLVCSQVPSVMLLLHLYWRNHRSIKTRWKTIARSRTLDSLAKLSRKLFLVNLNPTSTLMVLQSLFSLRTEPVMAQKLLFVCAKLPS